MKRYEILGKRLHNSREQFLHFLEKGDADALARRADPRSFQQFDRELQISGIVTYAVLEHLGYGPIENLAAKLERGVDNAIEYFFGNWWVGNESDARNLDKSRPDRELRWFGVLPNLLLLGGLTGRWQDVERICSWFDASIEMEYQAGQLEDEYMQLFLGIASNLRAQPMPGVQELLAKVRTSRTKRPRLLCAAWEAAINKDQKTFDKALKESVAHFLKTGAADVPNPNFWVALDPSLVWLIAERNGLSFPKLPEKVDAAIVRRQTIGLAKEG
jgi:hypothetical protein